MRAATRSRYGPPEVIRIEQIPLPEATEGRVLIKVRAASVNRSDWEVLTGSPPYARMEGLRRPKVQTLGSDVAGTVEAVGDGVTSFRPGEEVFGDTMYFGNSTFAEYVSVSQKAPLIPIPAGLSFESAATLPQSGVLALQGLRRVRPTVSDDRVLINGAGGGGGTFAIQLAKRVGAHVIAVDNAGKLEMMGAIGADHVIDHSTEDYVRSGPYDRILDFVGSRSVDANRRALAPEGVYSIVGGPVRRLLATATFGWLASKAGRRHLGVLMAKQDRDDLVALAELVVGGAVTPVIDRTYSLEEVPDALRQVGANRVLGKAVITI